LHAVTRCCSLATATKTDLAATFLFDVRTVTRG
jgi:hypothetical protein